MKMLRSNKVSGRCCKCGHGSRCEVSREIQSIPITRSKEKNKVKKDIDNDLKECYDYENGKAATMAELHWTVNPALRNTEDSNPSFPTSQSTNRINS